MALHEITIADAIEEIVDARVAGATLQTGTVTAVAGGLVTARTVGAAAAEAGLARLIPRLPRAGDRVALARLGSSRVVLGVLSRAAEALLDLGAPVVGQSYRSGKTQSGADNALGTTGTADTALYTTALTFAWTDLPDGTYTVVAEASGLFTHSAGGAVNIAVEVAGQQQALGGVACANTTTPGVRLERVGIFTDVAVLGGLTVKVQCKSSAAGTTKCANPSVVVTATRTA